MKREAVSRQLQAELLKQRTTRTMIGVATAMLAVAVAAIGLHAFGLKAGKLANGTDQIGILRDVGVHLGALFAALAGAMTITAEIRHGTIRPTLLHTPQRSRVVAAKAALALLTGAVFGMLATGAVAGVGTMFLAIRGITVHVNAGDYLLLIVGGAAAASLWAVIGLGVGAVIRSQVPTIVGLLVWVLFVENTLDGTVPGVAKFAPAALGQAIAGATNGTLHNPALGAVVLSIYAAAAYAVGRLATTRRDFA